MTTPEKNTISHGRRYLRAGLCLAAAAGLAFLVVAPFLAAPGRDNAEPAIEEGAHVTEVVIRTLDVPIARFHAWFIQAKLEDILPGSAMIPRVVGSELIDGNWGEVGARRRVLLQGGGSALEQITANDVPRYFAYKVWAIGGPGERLIRYIRGEFFVTPLPGDRTRVEWRYSFKPRTPLAQPYVSAFASLGFKPFLVSGIEAIKAAAERSAGESLKTKE